MFKKLLLCAIFFSLYSKDLDTKKEQPQSSKDSNLVKPNELILLDKVEAVVVSDKPSVITTADIAKRGFDGNKYELKDIVNEILLDSLADQYKMSVNDEDITRYLEKMKMSEDQISAMAKANGYNSLREFYDQFKRMYKAGQALNFKVASELVFTEDVIYQYYLENPKTQEAVYTVSISTIVDRQATDLNDLRNRINSKVVDVSWSEPYQFPASQIAESNKFIFDLKEGELFIKDNGSGVYDLFKLVTFVPEIVCPLSERREEIVNELKGRHYRDVVENILKNLRDAAMVIEPSFEKYPAPIYADFKKS